MGGQENKDNIMDSEKQRDSRNTESNRKQKGEAVKMETQQEQEYKIYRVYRKRISLNVSEISTNYVKVHVEKQKNDGKVKYIFTVEAIE